MFIRKFWLPISVFIVVICGIGLYLLATQPPKDPIVIYKPIEPLPKSEVKGSPIGDTSQGGHWHGDEWHADPHETPVEQPSTVEQWEAETPSGDPTSNLTQDISELSADTQDDQGPYEKWKAWHRKLDELHAKESQASKEMFAVMPATEEEQKRYETDEDYKKEVGRKLTDAAAKAAKLSQQVKDHWKERPPAPGESQRN